MDRPRVPVAVAAAILGPAIAMPAARTPPIVQGGDQAVIDQAREALAREVASLVGEHGPVGAIVDGLVRALAQPPELHLERAGDEVLSRLSLAPASVWAAMQSFAQASGAEGITSAVVPLNAAALADLGNVGRICEGLNQLGTLCHLTLPLYACDRDLELPLGNLRLASLKSIELGLQPTEDFSRLTLQVTAPKAVDVYCKMKPGSLMLTKSFVDFVDNEGNLTRETLAGVPYIRRATDFAAQPTASPESAALPPPSKRRAVNPQLASAELNLNMRARFSSGHLIVCRDLAPHWMIQQQKHLDGQRSGEQKSGPDGARFSYEDFISVGAIGKSVVKAQVNLVADDALDARDFMESEDYTVGFDRLGSLVGAHLDELTKGQSRLLLIRSSDHQMAIKLRVKETERGATQYVVEFYDPNRTATAVRSTFTSREQVRGQPAAFWMGRLNAASYAQPVPGKVYQHDFGWGTLEGLQWPPLDDKEGRERLLKRFEDRAGGAPAIALPGATPEQSERANQVRLRCIGQRGSQRLCVADSTLDTNGLGGVTHLHHTHVYRFADVEDVVLNAYVKRGSKFYVIDSAAPAS